jgi:hypothetical protein
MAARDQARRFRVIARMTGVQVRLYSRPGNDLTHRFPLIVDTLARLRSRSPMARIRLSPKVLDLSGASSV